MPPQLLRQLQPSRGRAPCRIIDDCGPLRVHQFYVAVEAECVPGQSWLVWTCGAMSSGYCRPHSSEGFPTCLHIEVASCFKVAGVTGPAYPAVCQATGALFRYPAMADATDKDARSDGMPPRREGCFARSLGTYRLCSRRSYDGEAGHTGRWGGRVLCTMVGKAAGMASAALHQVVSLRGGHPVSDLPDGDLRGDSPTHGLPAVISAIRWSRPST